MSYDYGSHLWICGPPVLHQGGASAPGWCAIMHSCGAIGGGLGRPFLTSLNDHLRQLELSPAVMHQHGAWNITWNNT